MALMLGILLLLMAGCAGRDPLGRFNTVIIDAGHGGHDSGALSRYGGPEKGFALDVSHRLERKLQRAGFRTIMSRKDDRFIPLGQRARLTERNRKAIFVSIHFNWARSSQVRGIETYYHDSGGQQLARTIQNSMTRISGTRNGGIRRARFYVLRNSEVPAVLIEGGYLTNPTDAALINSPGFREELATRIAAGIIEQRRGRAAAASFASAVRD